jgi:hypothetical protein
MRKQKNRIQLPSFWTLRGRQDTGENSSYLVHLPRLFSRPQVTTDHCVWQRHNSIRIPPFLFKQFAMVCLTLPISFPLYPTCVLFFRGYRGGPIWSRYLFLVCTHCIGEKIHFEISWYRVGQKTYHWLHTLSLLSYTIVIILNISITKTVNWEVN